MRIAVMHNGVSAGASPEESDVLVQASTVSASLIRLGHAPSQFACSLDLEAARAWLSAERPHLVFNLVESLGGADRLAPLAPLLWDALNIPYTGAPSAALLATANKIETKRRLAAVGLPTPRLLKVDDEQGCRRAIVKPVWDHASVGMDDDAVVAAGDRSALGRAVERKDSSSGRPHFAEEYIDGREFNLSVLGWGSETEPDRPPQTLPAAEIDFSAFPVGKPHIVGSRAKWDASSFEYHHTPRKFHFPDGDQRLLDELSDLSQACWRLFDLQGYARIDFRVDHQGKPWILEINSNPCLSPDAGFAAALHQAHIDIDEAIARIVAEALPEAREFVATEKALL